MSAEIPNQNGDPTPSGSQSMDPARGPSLKSGNPVKTHWFTDTAEINFAFAWTIKKFSLRKETVGQCLESPIFPSGPKDEIKWRLRVYPKGRCGSKQALAVYLKLVDCGRGEAPATKFELSILNDKCVETHTCRSQFQLIFLNDPVGFENYVTLETLFSEANGLLPDDSLTILCEGILISNEVYMQPAGSQAQLNDLKYTPSFGGSLFENQEFSDFTLSVGGKELFVYKAVLTEKSPLFAAMFKHAVEENQQNRATIEDIDYNVLKEMLLYMYTGKLENVGNMARELLAAADTYNVSGLKKMCEDALCSSLTTENAADLLVLANTHSAQRLKTRVVHFICACFKDVMLTPGWKNMSSTQPSVVVELFETIASKYGLMLEEDSLQIAC